MGYGVPPIIGYKLPRAPSLRSGQALGQTVVYKNPGDPTYYDFQFEHQGPGQKVYVLALLQDQGNSNFVGVGNQSIILPKATQWAVRTGRIQFTMPSMPIPGYMPTGWYYPWIQVCDKSDCSGSVVVWGWNYDIWLKVPAAGGLAIANPMVLDVG